MQPHATGRESGREGHGSAPAPPPAVAPPLEMINVTVTSLKNPERTVVAQVNWRVDAGAFWAIGGLQASGKSDFMATAAGLLPPATGTCRVFGRDLAAGFEHEDLAARLRLGLVFDGGRLLQHLTLAENISLPLRYHQDCSVRDCAAPVAALLELTDLARWADEYPGNITPNRRQRVGLARALALKPELLLLDSPLTGLDPRDAAWWLDVLSALSAGHPLLERRPVTLVVTGDDLRPWKNRAREFAALRNKNFVTLGSPPEAAGPAEMLMQELLGAESIHP